MLVMQSITINELFIKIECALFDFLRIVLFSITYKMVKICIERSN